VCEVALFATVHRIPREVTVLSLINWIKALQSSRKRNMTRNQTLGLLLAVRQLPCFAHVVWKNDLIEIGCTSTIREWQPGEIQVSILLMIRVTVRFYF